MIYPFSGMNNFPKNGHIWCFATPSSRSPDGTIGAHEVCKLVRALDTTNFWTEATGVANWKKPFAPSRYGMGMMYDYDYLCYIDNMFILQMYSMFKYGYIILYTVLCYVYIYIYYVYIYSDIRYSSYVLYIVYDLSQLEEFCPSNTDSLQAKHHPTITIWVAIFSLCRPDCNHWWKALVCQKTVWNWSRETQKTHTETNTENSWKC